MTIKIAIASPLGPEIAREWGYAQMLEKFVNEVKDEKTEVEFRYVERNREEHIDSFLFTAFPFFLDNKILLEQLYQAQEAGADGCMVACGSDPAIDELRGLLKVPVTASLESQALSACMAGPKFAVVTGPDRRLAEGHDRCVRRYGLWDRCTGVFPLQCPLEDFISCFKDPEILRKPIETLFKKVIDDGAHSIILGSTGLSVVVRALGITRVPEYDAPVFDSASAPLKMLEMRIALKQKVGVPPTCRAGEFALYPEEDIKNLFEENNFRYKHC